MVRTYRSHSQLAFSITFKGRSRNIHFIPFTGSGSYFTTTDKELATVLEASSLYGKYFVKDLERCEDDVYANDVNMEELVDNAVNESASDEPKEYVDVEDITNIPDAQKYLQDKGIAIRYLRSKAQVMRKAQQLGIRFPNLS